MINENYKTKIILLYFIVFLTINFAQKDRAMWIWNNANQVNIIINNYNNYRPDLFDFCKMPHGDPDHKINVLFFSCREAVYSNSDNLRNFLSEAVDSGITIEYLDGDPSWATYNQDIGFDRINKVIEFNSNTTIESEKLKGIHFDVEPYLLTQARGYQPPYWDTQRMETWESYVNFVDSCQSLIDAADSSLYFGIAIPRWYENHVGVEELKRLQSKVDYVAIMDYNENADVIIRDAENEINNAVELSKKVWIGVETKEVSPETVSFYEEGVSFMESQLDSAYSVYGNNPAFLGFAIHSYRYYKYLKDDPVSVNYERENPNSLRLFQNYPNPFNPSTNIKFYLEKSGTASLKIYNIIGEKKESLIDKKLGEGWHEVVFDNKNYPAGIYIYELSSNNYVLRKKMVLIK